MGYGQMSWTLERDIEQIIKGYCVTAVGQDVPVFGSMLDDDDSCDRSERDFPRVTIQADPAMIPIYRSSIHEVPLSVAVETYMGTTDNDDPKRTLMASLYGQVREALDICDPTSPTGYKTIALTFEQGGTNENDGAVNRMVLSLTFRVQKES
jgi:hypothetical protein